MKLAVAITIGLFFFVDLICVIIPDGINWFKRRRLDDFFPEWKNTHKLHFWYIIWMFLLLLNCGIISIAFVFDNEALFGILILVAIAYYFLLGFIYLVVKHNLRYYYDKRKQNKNDRDKTEHIRNENSENIDD